LSPSDQTAPVADPNETKPNAFQSEANIEIKQEQEPESSSEEFVFSDYVDTNSEDSFSRDLEMNPVIPITSISPEPSITAREEEEESKVNHDSDPEWAFGDGESDHSEDDNANADDWNGEMDEEIDSKDSLGKIADQEAKPNNNVTRKPKQHKKIYTKRKKIRSSETKTKKGPKSPKTCPHGCNKKFRTVRGLTAHLNFNHSGKKLNYV